MATQLSRKAAEVIRAGGDGPGVATGDVPVVIGEPLEVGQGDGADAVSQRRTSASGPGCRSGRPVEAGEHLGPKRGRIAADRRGGDLGQVWHDRRGALWEAVEDGRD